MEKYRHGGTGTVVEAVRLTEDNAAEVGMWCGGIIVQEEDPFTKEIHQALNVGTPDGVKRLSQGQYVVKYQRDFFVVRPGRFQSMYVPVEVPKGPVTPDVRESKIMPALEDG